MFDEHAGITPGGEECTTLAYADYSECPESQRMPDGGVIDMDCIIWTYVTECETLPDTQGLVIPLDGVQVLMRQLFTVRQAITDINGYFSTDYVRGKARYVVQ